MLEKDRGQRLGLAGLQLIIIFISALLTAAVPHTHLEESGIIVICIIHLAVFFAIEADRDYYRRGYLEEFREGLRYSFAMLLTLAFFSFMLEENFIISRRGIIYFTLLNTVGFYLFNIAIRSYYRTVGYKSGQVKCVFMISESDRVEEHIRHFKESGDWTARLIGVGLADWREEVQPIVKDPSLVVLAPHQLMEYMTKSVVDEVFISLPYEKYDIKSIVYQFELMGLDVSVNLTAFDYASIGSRRVGNLSGFSVMTFSSKLYKYSHLLAKRCLDIAGSLVGLFVCGLAALFLVPKIKADGGPAIFVQERVGKNGRIFKFYKFRSMRPDAEEIKKELMSQNMMNGLMFKMDDDPRITDIGRFIRKTSLDELPQFYNVLKGDMSLVGTRPPTLDEYEKYSPEQKRRLSFKPGITGLWQVSGRSEIKDFDDIVKLDVAYINTWTIWSDIKILIKTIKVVLMKDGAK